MSAPRFFEYFKAARLPTGPGGDALLLALIVAAHARDGSTFLSREELRAVAKISIDRVKRGLREAVAEGWLDERRGPGKPLWSIAVPEEPQRPTRKRAGQAVRRGKDRRAGGARTVELNPDGGARTVELAGQGPSSFGARTVELRGKDRRASPLEIPSSPSETPQETPQQSIGLVIDQKQILPEGSSPRGRQEPSSPTLAGQVTLPGLEATVLPPRSADPLQAPEVVEVLEHWRTRGYHTRPVADTLERRRRIRDRLDEGLDVGTLKAALDGASLDDWLMGRDPRNDTSQGGKVYKGLETILRDAGQVEKLATLWDVALAEGRVLEDGGDKHFDRFGNQRPRATPPSPEQIAAEAAARADGIAKFEAVMREQREKRERAEAEKLAAQQAEAERRRAALTPEERAEDDELRRISDRAKARNEAALAQQREAAGMH